MAHHLCSAANDSTVCRLTAVCWSPRWQSDVFSVFIQRHMRQMTVRYICRPKQRALPSSLVEVLSSLSRETDRWTEGHCKILRSMTTHFCWPTLQWLSAYMPLHCWSFRCEHVVYSPQWAVVHACLEVMYCQTGGLWKALKTIALNCRLGDRKEL